MAESTIIFDAAFPTVSDDVRSEYAIDDLELLEMVDQEYYADFSEFAGPVEAFNAIQPVVIDATDPEEERELAILNDEARVDNGHDWTPREKDNLAIVLARGLVREEGIRNRGASVTMPSRTPAE